MYIYEHMRAAILCAYMLFVESVCSKYSNRNTVSEHDHCATNARNMGPQLCPCGDLNMFIHITNISHIGVVVYLEMSFSANRQYRNDVDANTDWGDMCARPRIRQTLGVYSK